MWQIRAEQSVNKARAEQFPITQEKYHLAVSDSVEEE